MQYQDDYAIHISSFYVKQLSYFVMSYTASVIAYSSTVKTAAFNDVSNCLV